MGACGWWYMGNMYTHFVSTVALRAWRAEPGRGTIVLVFALAPCQLMAPSIVVPYSVMCALCMATSHPYYREDQLSLTRGNCAVSRTCTGLELEVLLSCHMRWHACSKHCSCNQIYTARTQWLVLPLLPAGACIHVTCLHAQPCIHEGAGWLCSVLACMLVLLLFHMSLR
jgi:hypothetical protein